MSKNIHILVIPFVGRCNWSKDGDTDLPARMAHEKILNARLGGNGLGRINRARSLLVFGIHPHRGDFYVVQNGEQAFFIHYYHSCIRTKSDRYLSEIQHIKTTFEIVVERLG
jgi:hypothetical protein